MTQDRNPLSPDAVGLEGLFEGMILDIHYANGHTSRATVTSRVFHRFRADMGNLPSVSLRWHAGGEGNDFLGDLGIARNSYGNWHSNYAVQFVPTLAELIAEAQLSQHPDVTDEHFPTALIRAGLMADKFEASEENFAPRKIVDRMSAEGIQPATMRELAFYAGNGWDGETAVAALADPWNDQFGRPMVGWLHNIGGRGRTISVREFNEPWSGSGWNFLAIYRPVW